MTQVKEFMDDNGDIDVKMNIWLRNYSQKIKVLDIKYSITVLSGRAVTGALIVFRVLREMD